MSTNVNAIGLSAVQILRELPEEVRVACIDNLIDGLSQAGRSAVLGKYVQPTQTDAVEFYEVFEDMLPQFFTTIHVAVKRTLNDAQARSVGAALGYAFAEHIRGDARISEPVFLYRGPDAVLLKFTTDTREHGRSTDNLDYDALFESAIEYIQNGSPVRKGNSSGIGTKGTRLVQGIGTADLTFSVADEE